MPFANDGAKVVALEPVKELADELLEKAKRQGISEMPILTETWEDVSLTDERLKEQFDLVFASLTPGIHNAETLEKMISLSRKWCFLCESAGRRRNQVQEELWQKFFNEPMPLSEFNIMYPLNYLYSLGYSPRLQLWTEEWGEESGEEEAIENICRFFSMYLEMTDQIKEDISEYVAKCLIKGVFREEYQVTLGMILWNVKERWANE